MVIRMSLFDQHNSRHGPRGRWYQFNLRTLLIAVALAAGTTFAWVKAVVEPYRLQREAMAAISNLGGAYKTEEAVGWIRYVDSKAQDVVMVDLANCDEPHEYLLHLTRLPRLRTLVVGGFAITDEQLAVLSGVVSLKGVVLDSTAVTDEGIDILRQALPEVVVFRSERRAVQEVSKLGASVYYSDFYGSKEAARASRQDTPPEWLRQEVADDNLFKPPFTIVDLDLKGMSAAEGDLAWLGTFSSLESLAIAGTLVIDDILIHLRRNDTLTHLRISGAKISDAAVARLQELTRLSFLDIRGTAISAGCVERLKEALPQCDIRY